METNYKREAVIYISFLICIIIIMILLPIYLMKIYIPNFIGSYSEGLIQFFSMSIIILIFSMIIVSIFI